MVLSNPLNTVHRNVNFLPRTQLGDEDVGVGGADGVGGEGVDLLAGGLEDDVACVDGGVGVEF